MPANDLVLKSTNELERFKLRRTCREFSDEIPDIEAVKNCIACAGLAPSGANMQPWTFVLVSDKNLKSKIRIKAEEIEKKLYSETISDEWAEKLSPLNLSFEKPFLESAPYLICIFSQSYSIDNKDNKIKHYYVNESVGISIGFLISSLHSIGLSCLTYTPSPIKFLNEILERPINEKPVMILALGYPDQSYVYPNISKKDLSEILICR